MTDTDDKKLEEGQTEAEYGGCEGPNAMYVKLISSDDHEFIINRDYALTSGTIKAMLSGPGKICAVPPKCPSVFRYYGLFLLFLCEMKRHYDHTSLHESFTTISVAKKSCDKVDLVSSISVAYKFPV